MGSKTKHLKLKSSDWRQGVADVLQGCRKSFSDENISVAPNWVILLVRELGGEHISPEDGGMLETNGWDYDWWLQFERNGKAFTAAGSGFYGGFEFSPSE